MKLEPGIPLKGLDDNPSRVCISAGNTTPAQAGLDASHYEPGARVPLQSWRQADRETLSCLTQSEKARGEEAFVAIARPPATAIAVLSALLQDLKRGERDSVAEHVARACETFLDLAGPVTPLGVGVRASNLATTTTSDTANVRIGLHVDSWSRLPAEERWRAQNRLCLNLGEQPRRFLFINQTLDSVVDRLQDKIASNHAVSVNTLAKTFLEAYPDYPIVALNIYPGEAYIAPTDAIIHDGSTLATTTPDISLTVLGRFRWAPSEG